MEDRGYLFGDGVYDVIPVHAGKLVAADRHFERLGRSLGELRIAWPMAGQVRMSGAASEAFRGSFDPADYAAAA